MIDQGWLLVLTVKSTPIKNQQSTLLLTFFLPWKITNLSKS